MEEDDAVKTTVSNLRKAIENRDWLSFSREHFKVANLSRRALFRGERGMLNRWYPELSSLLIWFYRSGKAEWADADRSMGGLDMLLSLMGNFLETRTLEETRNEVLKSAVDRDILLEMHTHAEGVRSGALADRLGKSQNSVTNRLPGLEKLGLVVRSRLGKNSIVYLTPKGRGIAEKVREEANIAAVCRQPGPSGDSKRSIYLDPCAQNRAHEEPVRFWNVGPWTPPMHENLHIASTPSSGRTIH